MHVLIQEFFCWGRGGQARLVEKSSDVCLGPQLILQFTEGIRWLSKNNTTISKALGGSNFSRFPGGSNFFPGGGGGGGGQGGPNANFYRNPYNL